jgi:type IX secretion system PorP/SprF family membrane protein
MKKHIYSLLIFASFSVAKAQILSYDFYSYKQGNMFNVNPAYAGKGDGVNVVLDGQTQNNGVAYADKDIMAGVYSKVSAKQAIGGKLISDTRGAFQLLKADLSYAYIVKIASEHSLTLGLSAGILNNNLLTSRIDNYQSLDKTDPTLTKSYYNTTQFSAGVGLLYIYKALEVSVSLPNIVTTNQSVGNTYLNSAVFYTFKVGSKFKLTPWVTYQNIPVTKGVGALLLKATYKNMLWVQAGYQTNKSFCAMLGINVENIGISYGYNFSNSAFSTISTGRQEIMLSYKILPKKQNKIADDNQTSNASLADILARLDNLANTDITSKNSSEIKKQLDVIKKQLQNAEIDNSSPEKAQQVSSQLSQIDEKLKIIEKKLLNEK